MPFVIFKSIYSVSSEDSNHCAVNLLKNETSKKWKTLSVGDKSAHIVLQFEQPELITGVDIGNEHSAFIEVLVGKNGCNSQDFKELVLTSSFMTPIESKNSINTNRIRCFNQSEEAWIKDTAELKWDLIKFICTQPFNKHVQYGLSLIKVHIAAHEKKELVPKTFFKQQQEISEQSKTSRETNKFVGLFKMREHSDDDSNDSTTLFSRWKKQSTTPELEKQPNVAAQIRDASRHYNEKTTKPKNLKFNKDHKKDVKEEVKILDRNRNDLLYNENDEMADEKFEKKIAIDRKNMEEKNKDKQVDVRKERKNETKPLNTPKIDLNKLKITKKLNTTIPSKMKDLFDDDSDNDEITASTSSKDLQVQTNRKRQSSDDMDLKDPKKKKYTDQYKPLNRLLEDVILVISGIQNPRRADIRSKALQLGAKYKPDWDKSCTHLVCAFKNTPKYKEVKKANGKIITATWIEDCYKLKKRIPWRRHALDSDEEHKSESEEEILDIALRPHSISKNETKITPKKKEVQKLKKNYYINSDSEDEIENISTTVLPTKNENKQHNDCKEINNFDSKESFDKNIDNSTSDTKKTNYNAATDEDDLTKKEKLELNGKKKDSHMIYCQDHNNSKEIKDFDSKESFDKNIENSALDIKKDIYDITTDEDDLTKKEKMKLKGKEKDFFKDLKFYLDTKLNVVERNKLIFMIKEFGGTIADLNITVNYIISNSLANFDNLHFDFNGEIIKPLWVYECNDMECFIPCKRYLA